MWRKIVKCGTNEIDALRHLGDRPEPTKMAELMNWHKARTKLQYLKRTANIGLSAKKHVDQSLGVEDAEKTVLVSNTNINPNDRWTHITLSRTQNNNGHTTRAWTLDDDDGRDAFVVPFGQQRGVRTATRQRNPHRYCPSQFEPDLHRGLHAANRSHWAILREHGHYCECECGAYLEDKPRRKGTSCKFIKKTRIRQKVAWVPAKLKLKNCSRFFVFKQKCRMLS